MLIRRVDYRRYLVEIDTSSTRQVFTDCLVIGGGIAGLRAAIEAADSCKVTLACKTSLDESNTWNAQGGIAAVLASEDSFELHIEDTLKAGCGICNESVVRRVIKDGPGLIRQLMDWGTEFDVSGDKLEVTLEGGHSFARVAHSHGDSTGKGIAEGLIGKIRDIKNIDIMEEFFVIDLITNGNGDCVGAVGKRKGAGLEVIWAANTILATGGAGRLWRETTNPRVATGDGLAIAYRAGAVLSDLEFMQFHPTTLYVAGASRALITEALRGEGGILVDASGEAFMKEYHQAAELAPRDVVSRAILDRMLKTGTTHVYLDIRHFKKEHLARRFPLISELCRSFDIDVNKELIPVRPSAHYMLGGVKVDSNAATNVNHLYACGEVAATGLHGANRLGSNSLLEGLVFGKIAGRSAVENTAGSGLQYRKINYEIPVSDRSRLDTDDIRNSLRAIMWRNVGITRKENLLSDAQDIIQFWQRYVLDKVFESPYGWECQNMLTTSLLIARAAYNRQESRGVHFRSDFPERDDENYAKHFDLSID